ncbi:MAG: 3-methyl-2-oxobutanoate hydroxymethyltransferase, partial [Bacteroidota bacterium]
MSVNKEIKRVTTHIIRNMKASGEKISMLTAYDFSMARILDEAGVDILLVGDSASNVMAGHETTLPITLDQMIYHASSVIRAVKRSLVIVDLPFGSYQGNSKIALESTIRIMKESGAHAVKLEGGAEIQESIVRILSAGVPVMGHLGLTPQSIYKFGTYTVRAKKEAEAQKLKEDAMLLQELGCFGMVLEKIPAQLAAEVTEMLDIPTIGIGAGPHTSGQVLVSHDLIGLTKDFK